MPRGQLCMTMTDYLKRTGPKGDMAPVVEAMDEVNEIADDMMYMEANGDNYHRTVIRTGLPEVAWRLLNYGVGQSKSTTRQVDDKIGMLEGWSIVDAALARQNGNKPEFMLSEEIPFYESMNQEVVRTLFYGGLDNEPASFVGLSPRYSTIDESKASSARNVIDYGGKDAALCTSIWLMTWSDHTAHMIYPKGTELGLRREQINGGQPVPVADENSKEYMAYKTHYEWTLGFCLRDWRSCVRICNVDTADLKEMVEKGAVDAARQKLNRVMLQAYNRVPKHIRRVGRVAWYMHSDVMDMLDIIAAEKGNVNLTIGEFEGKTVTSFKGAPVRQCDALEIGEEIVG